MVKRKISRKRLNLNLRKWGIIFLLFEIILLVSLSWGLHNFDLEKSFGHFKKNSSETLTPIDLAKYLSGPKAKAKIRPREFIEQGEREQFNLSAPILMYHHIRDYNNHKDKIGAALSVSPAKLEEHLRTLKDRGYQTVSLRDFSAQRRNPSFWRFTAKPIILTFDDGYLDNYENAFPLLKKYEFTATFFIITQENGTNPAYMNLNAIKEMKEAGMEFGSHSLSHPDLRQFSPEELARQLETSKQNMNVFCYPGGRYNEVVIKAVKKAGYKAAVTTHNGIAHSNSEIFQLPRIRITNETNFEKMFP